MLQYNIGPTAGMLNRRI